MEGRKTIIFDLDGTLLDTLEDLARGVNYCMKKYGGPIHSNSQVREMVGNGIYNLMERALPQGRENPAYDACMKDFSPYYAEHMYDHTCPYEGIPQMLECLKNLGYRMAIVSNKFDAAVKGLNDRFFSDWIQVAIGEQLSRGIQKKPAPDTVFAAMEELNVPASDCVYVGDSEVDLQTAANAGIPCVSVTWGFKNRDFLIKNGATELVDSTEALLSVLTDEKI